MRLEHESVWLSLGQIAELFARDKSVVSRHLKNIFESEELGREAVVARNATTAADAGVVVRTSQASHWPSKRMPM